MHAAARQAHHRSRQPVGGRRHLSGVLRLPDGDGRRGDGVGGRRRVDERDARARRGDGVRQFDVFLRLVQLRQPGALHLRAAVASLHLQRAPHPSGTRHLLRFDRRSIDDYFDKYFVQVCSFVVCLFVHRFLFIYLFI